MTATKKSDISKFNFDCHKMRDYSSHFQKQFKIESADDFELGIEQLGYDVKFGQPNRYVDMEAGIGRYYRLELSFSQRKVLIDETIRRDIPRLRACLGRAYGSILFFDELNSMKVSSNEDRMLAIRNKEEFSVVRLKAAGEVLAALTVADPNELEDSFWQKFPTLKSEFDAQGQIGDVINLDQRPLESLLKNLVNDYSIPRVWLERRLHCSSFVTF